MNEPAGQAVARTSATIMMVDDEPTTLEVLESFLRSEGYGHFVTTTDPRRVMGLLAEERPDVLLLNLMMPGVSGLEILGAMRSHAELRHVPVIILTSSTDPRMKKAALERGASDFLGKPVDPSELALRVQNTLESRTRREEGSEPEGPPSPSFANEPSGAPVVSRLSGTNPQLHAIAVKFVGRLEEKLAEMEASWAARDHEALVELAHWLKGAGGTVGFDAFTEPAETLRLQAKECKDGEIAASIQTLRGLAERIDLGHGESS